MRLAGYVARTEQMRNSFCVENLKVTKYMGDVINLKLILKCIIRNRM